MPLEPVEFCKCGPERDAKDKEAIEQGTPPAMLWHCLDCGKVRPNAPPSVIFAFPEEN